MKYAEQIEVISDLIINFGAWHSSNDTRILVVANLLELVGSGKDLEQVRADVEAFFQTQVEHPDFPEAKELVGEWKLYLATSINRVVIALNLLKN